jgi:uncharacterized lipoprotein YajG
MKRFLTICAVALALAACSEAPKSTETTAKAPAAAEPAGGGLDAAAAGDSRRADPATAPPAAHDKADGAHDHGPDADHKH